MRIEHHQGRRPFAPVPSEPVGEVGISRTGLAAAGSYVHEQLSLGVGELV